MKNWNGLKPLGNFQTIVLALVVSIFIQFGLSQEARSFQTKNDSPNSSLVTWVETQFKNGLDSLNVPGATLVLVQGDSILYKTGYGIESLKNKIKVSPDSSIFHLGSVSKTILAIAVMQLYEKGLVELDRDVNEYLTSFQIEQAYDQPITVRHLLTHTAGFDERNLLHASKSIAGRIEPAEHLKKRLPPQIRPPGYVFTYSNYGYTTLGVMVEDISGLPFHKYVDENILMPLGMHKSGFLMKKEFEGRYVPSYRQIEGELNQYEFVYINIYPSGSFTSTSSDMARFITMLLQQGTFEGKAIINPSTFRTMVETDFAQFDESKVSWSLGFEKKMINGKTVLEHRGDIQGFTNYLIIYPDYNIGIFVSMNASRLGGGVSDSRKFLAQFKQRFENKLFIINQRDLTIPNSSSLEGSNSLAKFLGNYRYTRYAHTTFDKVATLIGFAPEVSIKQLENHLYIPELQDTLLHIKDDLFYSRKNNSYASFAFDIDGMDYFFRDGITSYEKLDWYEVLNFQIPWIVSIILLQVVFLVYLLIHRFTSNTRLQNRRLFLYTTATNSFLIIVFITAFVYALLAIDPTEFTYRIPLFLKAILFVPYGLFVTTILVLWTFVKVFKDMQLGKAEVTFFTLVILSSASFILWLNYWNLIGLNY